MEISGWMISWMGVLKDDWLIVARVVGLWYGRLVDRMVELMDRWMNDWREGKLGDGGVGARVDGWMHEWVGRLVDQENSCLSVFSLRRQRTTDQCSPF